MIVSRTQQPPAPSSILSKLSFRMWQWLYVCKHLTIIITITVNNVITNMYSHTCSGEPLDMVWDRLGLDEDDHFPWSVMAGAWCQAAAYAWSQAGELSTPTTWTLPGPGPMATTHYYVLVPTPFRCMNRIDSSHYVYYYHSPYKHKTYHTPHSHTNLSLLNDMVFTADRIKWKLHL